MFVLLRKRRLIPAAFFCGFLLLPLLLWAGLSVYPVQTFGVENGEARVVIIDPGHGGEDGGAVADDGTEESGINLAVSLRLEGIFRFLGVPTEMTRREDVMVCDSGLATLRQRKVSDIHNRAALVNQTPGAVLLSIHQNSLPSSPVTHGAQVFWNRQEGAEALARTLQAGLNSVVNTHRAKEPKQIPDSIYLMNHVDAPAVLVECGFLSNREEAARLQQEDYQKTLATVIAAGYLRWMAGEDRK